MAWNSSVEHNGPMFHRYKPERPQIDIASATTHRHGGVSAVADNVTLRTPVDLPLAQPDTPWYNPPYAFSSFEPVRISNNLEPLPPTLHYERFQVYEDFSRSMDVDVVPPSPPRGMLQLNDQFDDRELEFSPPSPSHRPLNLPEPDSGRYVRLQHNDYRNAEGTDDDLQLQSPPSPSRRTSNLLPHDWMVDDCPELSPPSPRQGCLGLPPLQDEYNTEALYDEYFNETPSLRDTASILSSSPQTPPLTLSTRLFKEYDELEALQRRTETFERLSRARTMKLRTHERTLARAVAERTSQARETSRSESQSTEGDGAPSIPGSPEAQLADIVPSSGSNKEIVRFYRTRATRLMLDRIEEKRKRKKEKERLKELRIILGVGRDALLDFATASEVVTEEASQEAMENEGLGLGLVLEQPKACDIKKEEMEFQLAERHRAMQHLVAYVTIRRRELERRSLLEAGDLAEAYLKENERGSGDEDQMQMEVESPAPLLKPDLSYLAKRPRKGQSPLRKELVLEDLQEDFEQVEEPPEESKGLLFGF